MTTSAKSIEQATRTATMDACFVALREGAANAPITKRHVDARVFHVLIDATNSMRTPSLLRIENTLEELKDVT